MPVLRPLACPPFQTQPLDQLGMVSDQPFIHRHVVILRQNIRTCQHVKSPALPCGTAGQQRCPPAHLNPVPERRPFLGITHDAPPAKRSTDDADERVAAAFSSTGMRRMPAFPAMACEPSVLPLSAMTIWPRRPERWSPSFAFSMQRARVSASFRQGIRMVSSTGSLMERPGETLPTGPPLGEPRSNLSVQCYRIQSSGPRAARRRNWIF